MNLNLKVFALLFVFSFLRGVSACGSSTNSSRIVKRATKSCQIDIKLFMDGETTAEKWPMILDTNYNFKSVSSSGIIEMTQGEKFIVSCPGSTINGQSFSYGTFVCVDKQNVKRDGGNVEDSFYKLKCGKMPASENKLIKTFNDGRQIFEIGFPVSSTIFVPLIKVYFKGDESFTKHSMGHEAQQNQPIQKLGNKPDFLQGKHPIPKLNEIYNQNKVFENLKNVLGESKAREWMTGFDRGHLAANADFAFAYQQKATFYYLNALPQFHSFNSINWINVEKAVRNLASQNGKIDVYTGTSGQLMLNDGGYYENIYLDSTKKLGVPWIFWKIVSINSNPKYAFVGLNYPTHKDFRQEENRIKSFCVHCPSGVFTPLTDPTRGIVICCMYEDYFLHKKPLETYGIGIKEFN